MPAGATSGGRRGTMRATLCVVSPPSPGPAGARGVVRLLNTADGRVLCLAGEIDAALVESFLRQYGAEPAPVDGIDARSVTSLSAPARRLVLDHLDAAEQRGRQLTVRRSPGIADPSRLLSGRPVRRHDARP